MITAQFALTTFLAITFCVGFGAALLAYLEDYKASRRDALCFVSAIHWFAFLATLLAVAFP